MVIYSQACPKLSVLSKKGGINISKDILIIGESRCGKSTITNYLLNKYNNFEPIRGDSLEIALSSTLSRLDAQDNANSNGSNRKFKIFNLSSSVLAQYFKTTYEEIKFDLRASQKSIIIDTHSMTVEDSVKYFRPQCDIYCLGMPNETPENLKLKIRENDTRNDWTYYTGNMIMDVTCRNIIENSKYMQEECEKYHVKFWDTSGDRKQKLKAIIEEIEKSIINKE